MHITINGRPELLDGTTITLRQLAESHSIPTTGTAIALNGKVVSADKWDVTVLNEGDSLIVISAAYGG
ncbi:MAG: sulfur carrier protein ThiS [Muribaculaceae bacterium]|nr:sulfur carrier protein ThiS [Muribaculaceae bacterium]